MEKSIFWFRQDLRTYDNRGLSRAFENSKSVLPVFIFDTNLIEDFGEKDKRFDFISQMLFNLRRELEKKGGYLLIKRGKPEEIIAELCKKYDIKNVYANRSYSNYGSQKRDPEIKKKLTQVGIGFDLVSDFLLMKPKRLKKYQIFSPYKRAFLMELNEEDLALSEFDYHNFLPLKKDEENIILDEKVKHKYFDLEFFKKRKNFNFSNYEDTRNFPFIDGVSYLSPYIRFGVISIRELFLKVREVSSVYTSELIWREFWHHIGYYNDKSIEFQEKKRNIKWRNNEKEIKLFEDGKTGFPIIDASIRQLKETNWMHNRCRMVVASFLTKNLLVDWRIGEKFFKKYLLDYDETVNFGNWQWSASVGADPKPMRVFNPILQAQRFDTQAKFIKKYLPELQDEPLEAVLDPIKYDLNYIKPIVEPKESGKRARAVYKGEEYYL